MNKQDIIEAVAKEVKLTKADSKRALESILKNISKGVKKGGVQLVGFGSFKVVNRKARKGVNPQTGEQITIKASKTVKFSPAASLKKSL